DVVDGGKITDQLNNLIEEDPINTDDDGDGGTKNVDSAIEQSRLNSIANENDNIDEAEKSRETSIKANNIDDDSRDFIDQNHLEPNSFQKQPSTVASDPRQSSNGVELINVIDNESIKETMGSNSENDSPKSTTNNNNVIDVVDNDVPSGSTFNEDNNDINNNRLDDDGERMDSRKKTTAIDDDDDDVVVDQNRNIDISDEVLDDHQSDQNFDLDNVVNDSGSQMKPVNNDDDQNDRVANGTLNAITSETDERKVIKRDQDIDVVENQSKLEKQQQQESMVDQS
ncbi:hypothetical protein QR98_0084230, partial [Sarcoptes scabiei]